MKPVYGVENSAAPKGARRSIAEGQGSPSRASTTSPAKFTAGGASVAGDGLAAAKQETRSQITTIFRSSVGGLDHSQAGSMKAGSGLGSTADIAARLKKYGKMRPEDKEALL